MSKKKNGFLKVPAMRIIQPLGEFYVAKLDADVLLQLTYSDPLRIHDRKKSGFLYWLKGAQREESTKRLKEIGRYVDTAEAAFPNSIILSANYDKDGNLVEDDSIRWRVESEGDREWLVIPTQSKVASIIDGQHRLHGFNYAGVHKSMGLVCSIFLDLPTPYQAYLFATINFNQKKVDRSLAYELFGFNVEEEPPDSWSPEKVAVFLCRRLNVEKGSPFHQHITVAAQNDEILFKYKPAELKWVVSTATIVDGILRLISKNPKKDKDHMHQKPPGSRSRKDLQDDESPLRQLYLTGADKTIEELIAQFFDAASDHLFAQAKAGSYVFKTVGIQALFDVLRLLVAKPASKEFTTSDFGNILSKATHVDFADDFFQASGVGRTRIKNTIGVGAGIIKMEDLKAEDSKDYRRLLKHQILLRPLS